MEKKDKKQNQRQGDRGRAEKREAVRSDESTTRVRMGECWFSDRADECEAMPSARR